MASVIEASKIGGVTFPLEPSGEEMRRLVQQAMDRIVPHIESLPRQPAADVAGGPSLARSLMESLPEQGEAFDPLLELLFDRVVPKSFNTAGPGYLAYIPGGGIFHSAVADLIADSVNRYVGVFAAAPGLSQLEANVVRWLAEIIGYETDARGFLTSGGSLANLSAVVTARRELLPADFLSGTLYVSDQVHHSVQKAAMLAGFPLDNVRVIETDDAFRIRIDRLAEQIIADRADGMRPFFVVGSAGTTNTGACDDLDALADVAERENCWFHVDAAYGGFFMLTERGRAAMRGIERAGSVTLDPHKGMFLPYGTGSLVVRDGEALRRTFTLDAEYLPPMQDDRDLVDFCQISPELSRPFRGLRIWLPIKLIGIGPFRAALDEKLNLAQLARRELGGMPQIQIVAEPQLSIVAFRLTSPGLEPAESNDLNRRFIERINGRRRIYVTGTMLDGLFTIRICVLSFRTHEDRMREGLEDVRLAATELVGG